MVRQSLFALIMAINYVSCSASYPTISVEIPPGYTGWCFIIPIRDTSNMNIQKKGDSFTINGDGIAYIPSSILNIENENVIKVFNNGIDISSIIQYGGTVTSKLEEKKVYKYIQFYIPTEEEKKIKDDQYWRDKRYKLSRVNSFDSLLNKGKILFK